LIVVAANPEAAKSAVAASAKDNTKANFFIISKVPPVQIFYEA